MYCFNSNVYDFSCCYSIDEILCKLQRLCEDLEFNINELRENDIKLLGAIKDLQLQIDNLTGTTLANKVMEILNQWKDDGTLSQLINESAFKELNDKINGVVKPIKGGDILLSTFDTRDYWEGLRFFTTDNGVDLTQYNNDVLKMTGEGGRDYCSYWSETLETFFLTYTRWYGMDNVGFPLVYTKDFKNWERKWFNVNDVDISPLPTGQKFTRCWGNKLLKFQGQVYLITCLCINERLEMDDRLYFEVYYAPFNLETLTLDRKLQKINFSKSHNRIDTTGIEMSDGRIRLYSKNEDNGVKRIEIYEGQSMNERFNFIKEIPSHLAQEGFSIIDNDKEYFSWTDNFEIGYTEFKTSTDGLTFNQPSIVGTYDGEIRLSHISSMRVTDKLATIMNNAQNIYYDDSKGTPYKKSWRSPLINSEVIDSWLTESRDTLLAPPKDNFIVHIYGGFNETISKVVSLANECKEFSVANLQDSNSDGIIKFAKGSDFWQDYTIDKSTFGKIQKFVRVGGKFLLQV